MTCKICNTSETDSTSGICERCIHTTRTTRRYSIPSALLEQMYPTDEMRAYLEYWGKVPGENLTPKSNNPFIENLYDHKNY